MRFIIKFLIIAMVLNISSANFAIAEDIPLKQETKTIKGSATAIDINSENLEFFPETNQIIATGNAEVILKDQGSKLKADKMIFNQDEQTILAIGNVRLLKDGLEVRGDYTKIDLTKESALINHPIAGVDVINIKATTGNIYSDKIELFKGTAAINQTFDMVLSSNSIGNFDSQKTFKRAREKSSGKKSNYRIFSKEMTIKAEDKRNIIQLKNASVFAGKYKIAYIPLLEISTDKEMSQIETQLPEIGGRQNLGTFFGPGHVFYLPNGATIKAAPLLLKGDGKFGVGALGRLTTQNNRTEFAYGTAKKKVVVLGEHIFNDSLRLNYASNSYLDDGIFGNRMPDLGADLVYQKPTYVKDLDLFYDNRFSAGYAEDFSSGWGTGRYKWQGNIMNNNPLWAYKRYLELRTQTQYDISLYGNGSRRAIIRTGPRIDSKIGPLEMYAIYYQGGVYGETPFAFDRYDYGKSNVVFRGEYMVNRYVSLAYLTYLNLTKDNYNHKMLAENQITAIIGPDDVKLRLGFDTIRKRSLFGVDMLVGTDRSVFEYDKMNIIDPNKLHKTAPEKENKRKEL